jgi:hypothetical protein
LFVNHQSRAPSAKLFSNNKLTRNAINPHPSVPLPAAPKLEKSGALAIFRL